MQFKIVVLTGLAIALWLFSSWLVAFILTHRATPLHAEPPPEISRGRIQPVRLATQDAEQIGGWFIPGQEDLPAVLLLHGNGGSRSACLDQAEWMAKAGYPVLLITHRAHGDSTGDLNDLGYSGRYDVIAAIDYLERNCRGRPVIWGRSLGAAAAIFAAGELGDRVSGYVLECPYRDLHTAVKNRVNKRLPPPLNWVAYSGLSLTASLILRDVDRVSPLEASGNISKSIPVLLLAGGKDRSALPVESFELAERIGPRSQVIVFDEAGHLELYATDPDRYRETGLRFLSSCR